MITITKLTGEANHAEDLPLTEANSGLVEVFAVDPKNPDVKWTRHWQMKPEGLVCRSSTGGCVIIPLHSLGNLFGAADSNLRPPPMPQSNR